MKGAGARCGGILRIWERRLCTCLGRNWLCWFNFALGVRNIVEFLHVWSWGGFVNRKSRGGRICIEAAICGRMQGGVSNIPSQRHNWAVLCPGWWWCSGLQPGYWQQNDTPNRTSIFVPPFLQLSQCPWLVPCLPPVSNIFTFAVALMVFP